MKNFKKEPLKPLNLQKSIISSIRTSKLILYKFSSKIKIELNQNIF